MVVFVFICQMFHRGNATPRMIILQGCRRVYCTKTSHWYNDDIDDNTTRMPFCLLHRDFFWVTKQDGSEDSNDNTTVIV